MGIHDVLSLVTFGKEWVICDRGVLPVGQQETPLRPHRNGRMVRDGNQKRITMTMMMTRIEK